MACGDKSARLARLFLAEAATKCALCTKATKVYDVLEKLRNYSVLGSLIASFAFRWVLAAGRSFVLSGLRARFNSCGELSSERIQRRAGQAPLEFYARIQLRPRVSYLVFASTRLYLSTLLNELRQFGSYEKLNERIDWYLRAANPIELYREVIERWEQDFLHQTVDSDQFKTMTRLAN